MKILFVCSGNVCRSPMAEGILKHLIAGTGRGWEVSSAGTLGIQGQPASLPAVMACAERGVDISAHRSSALTADRLAESDRIYCMGGNHVHQVQLLHAPALRRTRLLGPLDPEDPSEEIPDPIGQDLDVYRMVRDRIWRACERIVESAGE